MCMRTYTHTHMVLLQEVYRSAWCTRFCGYRIRSKWGFAFHRVECSKVGIYKGTVVLHLKSQHIKILRKFLAGSYWAIYFFFFSLFGEDWDISAISFHIDLLLAWGCGIRHSFTLSIPDITVWEGERGGGAKSWKKGLVAYMFCIPGKINVYPN